MKRVLLLAMLVISCLSFVSCEKNGAEKGGLDINYIIVDPAIVKVDIGETCDFKVEAKLSNGTTKDITSECTFRIFGGSEYFTLNKNQVKGVARGSGAISIDYRNELIGTVGVHVDMGV